MGKQNIEAKKSCNRAFLHAALDVAVRFKVQFFGDHTDIFLVALSLADRH